MLQEYQVSNDLFQNILTYYPNTPDAENARFWKGLIAMEQQDYQGAAQEFETFLKEYPKDSDLYQEALWQLGEALYASNQFESARTMYERLIEQFPENSHVKIAGAKLRKTYYQEGSYDKALQAWSNVIQGHFRRMRLPLIAQNNLYWKRIIKKPRRR